MESSRQTGTLYHAKNVLQRSSVNGKVKTRFKAHHELLMVLGKCLMKENLMEFFGMASESSAPTREINSDTYERGRKWMRIEEKCELLESAVSKFICQNGYLQFDLDGGATAETTDDELLNYCSNLCYWYLQILEMDDTAKDGDITRIIPNCMNVVPLFFSHSRLSKYFVENLDYILKCEHLLSPLQRMRVLEGSVVNLRGGSRNNMESDLMQENSVRMMKDLIRQLGPNKTKAAIERTTGAAETISSIASGIDSFLSSRKVSTRHQKGSTYEDEKTLAKLLRKTRPFNSTAGRKCMGFNDIARSPFSTINTEDLKYRILQVVKRLHYGQAVGIDDEEEEEDSGNED